MTVPHPLDNPARGSLLGAHAWLAESYHDVLRYPEDIASFLALPDRPRMEIWSDVAALAGRHVTVILNPEISIPSDWEILNAVSGVQMIDSHVDPAVDSEAVVLGPSDVLEMLDLVERTRPGPFFPRTVELGTYLGIRRNGVLVAMAGERLRPTGWTEISAVCTDSDFRGQGLGTRLVLAVAAGIHERGERPFLHTQISNVNAIRLYESLGFVLRRELKIMVVRAPSN
ncbi:MAG TPA: GNAT family N-acetyltransferase [Candidatus Nanopelagicaceae bacterium]|nr:GNAT family N-acetyltransferase [Candidatus Nanopelagicaceae bacterium]